MKGLNVSSKRLLYPREEGTWRNMLSRCYNPKATGYQWYGGNGILEKNKTRGYKHGGKRV